MIIDIRKGIIMRYCWWSCCFIFLFLYAGVLFAQTQEQAAPQSDTGQEVSESEKQAPEKPVLEKPEPEKPAGIPITEISQSAQETRISLNKISTNLEPVSDILTIEERLPGFLNSLKRKRSGWFYESLNRLTTRKLQDLSQEWNILLNKLNGWENKLAKHSKTLEEDNSQLEEMTALWQLTSESDNWQRNTRGDSGTCQIDS